MKSNHAVTTIAGEALRSEAGMLARLWAMVATRLEALRGRQALAELLDFDDRQLADIGVTRGDIEWALAQPLSRDVTVELEAIRGGRSL